MKIFNLGLLSMLTVLLLHSPSTEARGAETYQEGSRVAEFTAKDQHGQMFAFQPGLRFLLIAFEMSTGKKANEKLDALGGDFLEQRRAVYVSNIHGMPGLGRVFALPKMKKYKHRIVLADEKGLLDSFPKKEDRVTLLTLDSQGRITAIRFWDPERDPIETMLAAPTK